MQEIQTNEHGQILITGEDGQTYPVQVSGHQLVTVPTGMYQTVVANIQGSESSPGGQVQVGSKSNPQGKQKCFQVIGTPIQIAGLSGQALQGVVMKQEPGETGSSQGLTITPVSLASHSQHVSVLQMGEVR